MDARDKNGIWREAKVWDYAGDRIHVHFMGELSALDAALNFSALPPAGLDDIFNEWLNKLGPRVAKRGTHVRL